MSTTTKHLHRRLNKLAGKPGPSHDDVRMSAALEVLRTATGHVDAGEREKWASRCASGTATPADEARLAALPLDALEAAGLETALGYAILLNGIFKDV